MPFLESISTSLHDLKLTSALDILVITESKALILFIFFIEPNK